MATLATALPNTGLWVPEPVDNSGDAGVHASLRLDSAGDPHIAYWTDVETQNAHLKLAGKGVATWNNELVPTGRGASTALAIDPHDRPWIAYYDLDASAMKVAHREAGVWRIDLVTSDLRGFAVGNTSIALAGDTPLVSFWSDAGLQVARRSATGAWQIENVDPNVRAGISSSLAVDAQGAGHVAYYDLSTESLKHASRGAVSWISETVDADPLGYAGEQCSLSIDNATGRLHIAYSSHSGLRHARFQDGTWHIEIVDPGVGLGMYPSIALDREGHPSIAYYDSVHGVLKIAQFTAAFQVVTVDQAGDVGGYASLVLDAEGQGRIAYYDWRNRTLKFARSVPPPRAAIVRIQGGTVRLFELDGAGSKGDSLKFEWSVNKPNVAAFPGGQNNQRLNVQFTGLPDTYTFTLTVTDAQQRQDKATFDVTIS